MISHVPTASSSAPKEESKQEAKEEKPQQSEKKDPAEPKDQQVDKSTPSAPKPSSADQKAPPPPDAPSAPKKDKTSTSEPKPAASGAAKAPGARGETRVKMNRMRLRIAERLKESQNAAASLTTFNEIDMSALMDMRKKYKDEILKTHDVKLGFMSAFAKACSLALKEIPVANASIDVSILLRI
jgi:2-oxoglutarate dehydrogenase E2 component (dihydrolipoamide succinyltransferase)